MARAAAKKPPMPPPSVLPKCRDDVDPADRAGQRRRAASLLAQMPVAWQSSTSTSAP